MHSSITVIKLDGELEFSRKTEIRGALTLNGSESAILIDFSEVTYADSTTLAEILRFYAQATEKQIPLALLIRSKQFKRVIDYAGLGEAFKIFEDRMPALTYLGSAKA